MKWVEFYKVHHMGKSIIDSFVRFSFLRKFYPCYILDDPVFSENIMTVSVLKIIFIPDDNSGF